MYSKNYTPLYCNFDAYNETSQVDGISMREIYRRFVSTGEISAKIHTGSYGTSEDMAFNPSLDVVDECIRMQENSKVDNSNVVGGINENPTDDNSNVNSTVSNEVNNK